MLVTSIFSFPHNVSKSLLVRVVKKGIVFIKGYQRIEISDRGILSLFESPSTLTPVFLVGLCFLFSVPIADTVIWAIDGAYMHSVDQDHTEQYQY